MTSERASLHDGLVADVEAFLARTEISPSRFGMESVGNPNVVFDLRKGRDLHLRTADKLYSYMDKAKTRTTNDLPSKDAEAAPN